MRLEWNSITSPKSRSTDGRGALARGLLETRRAAGKRVPVDRAHGLQQFHGPVDRRQRDRLVDGDRPLEDFQRVRMVLGGVQDVEDDAPRPRDADAGPAQVALVIMVLGGESVHPMKLAVDTSCKYLRACNAASATALTPFRTDFRQDASLSRERIPKDAAAGPVVPSFATGSALGATPAMPAVLRARRRG